MKLLAMLKRIFSTKKTIVIVPPPQHRIDPPIIKPDPPQPNVMLKEKIIQEIISIAHKWIGVRETKGKNRSPEIDALILSQNGSLGSPYCMYGVQHVVQSVCLKLNLKNPLPQGGSTQRVWSKIPIAYKKDLPSRGDLIFWQSRSDKTRGHVGIVASTKDANIVCIEFNTDGYGSRDGDGVWSKERKLSGTVSLKVLGFVDVAKMIVEKNSPKEKEKESVLKA